ncbi:circadian clock-controlled protein daywake-like [Homarus americanus]|uniref:circadian clock-controlled protein daywake-like n=1 Tax=Homarus americanus TaxID=6706 RepID=UPI001C437768|nr:circadian clock-controlled protein daywake-like [Homarus americanus]
MSVFVSLGIGWLLATTVVSTSVPTASDFLSQLQACKLSTNAELNVCLTQNFQQLKPFLSTGVPEIGLPVFDPVFIPKMVFSTSEGAVTVNASFNDVWVKGIANYSSVAFDSDVGRSRLSFNIHIPRLDARGTYSINGKILILPVVSSGPYASTLTGFNFVASGTLTVVPTADGDRLTVSGMTVDFTIDDVKLIQGSTSSKQDILQQVVNKFLNTNAKVILEEIKPAILRQMLTFGEDFMNNILKRIPVDAVIQN